MDVQHTMKRLFVMVGTNDHELIQGQGYADEYEVVAYAEVLQLVVKLLQGQVTVWKKNHLM